MLIQNLIYGRRDSEKSSSLYLTWDSPSHPAPPGKQMLSISGSNPASEQFLHRFNNSFYLVSSTSHLTWFEELHPAAFAGEAAILRKCRKRWRNIDCSSSDQFNKSSNNAERAIARRRLISLPGQSSHLARGQLTKCNLQGSVCINVQCLAKACFDVWSE